MKREGGRFTGALVASAALHLGAGALLWVSASGAEPLPEVRAYRVDIVSPPPNQLGELPVEAPSPEAGAAEPQPEAEPVAEPIPVAEPAPPSTPAPEPTPAPPVKTAPPENRKPTAAPKRSEPTKSAAKPASKPSASKTETPKSAPAPKPAAPKAGTAERGDAGSGDRPKPATGPDPVASSAGGEGLNVRIEGAEFVNQAYIDNLNRQVKRYFRPPSNAESERAEVLFFIQRDGSVTGIELIKKSANVQFNLAALEAIELAGRDRAFGPLPDRFPGDQLPVLAPFTPNR